MKVLIAAALMLSAAGAGAQVTAPQFPSCDLQVQHALKGDMGGSIKDPRQAHISARANILEADLSSARKARRLTQAATDALFRRVQAVRAGANRYTKRQGFLSAGEVASYDRALDAVAAQVCAGIAAPGAAAAGSDSDYLQHRAASLNSRVDAAVRQRRLTRGEATRLHVAIRQVQTEAGHLQTVNGTIGRPDADRMNQRLTDVERALTHQP